ncbi:hypothetical protein D3C81_2279600 [compost metagenome]
MMYRRERLNHEQFRHLDATWLCHTANVITQQIDNHQIFGPVLGRIGQLLRLFCIQCGIGKAG